MSAPIVTRAAAKLNLSLDVTGKMPDGYHAMKMLMLSVTLYDDIRITLNDSGQVHCVCGLPYIPRDQRNIACRAARLFLDAVEQPRAGAEIAVRKRIPVGAGMAGGSTDAAAVLRALNAHFGAPFSLPRLQEMGLTLGSDVPYCLLGGSALAEGRGEILTPLQPLPDCAIVICKPGFAISTPELFSRLDWRKIRRRPNTEEMLSALHAGDLPRLARRMYNIFEDVLPPSCTAVEEIKRRLLSMGALGAVMTGTGSAVFGIFDDDAAAAAARDSLAADWRECFLCRPERSPV